MPGVGPVVRRLLLAVASAALGLALLEGAARLLPDDWKRPPVAELRPSFRTITHDGRDYLIRQPEQGFQFPPWPVRKEAGERRVICIGGSTVLGLPIPSHAFPAVLERLLAQALPGAPVEVVNAGFGGRYSEWELAMLDELLPLEPDLVVLYSCQNEYRELNVRRLMERERHPWLDRARRAVSGLALAGLLARAIDAEPAVESSVADAPVAGRPIDGPEYAQVARCFRENLERFVERCDSRGVPVILCTVVSNLRDSPPVASVFRAGLPPADQARARQLVDGSAGAAARGDFAAALDLARQAERIDATPAGVHFALGRALEGGGDFDAARREFEKARDCDGRLQRAPAILNEAVREVAAAHGVALADLEATFASRTPHGIVGSEWILDNVHPNLAGHALIARALLDVMARRGLLVDAGAPGRVDEQAALAQLPEIPGAEVDEREGIANLAIALESGISAQPAALARRHFHAALAAGERAASLLGLGMIAGLEHDAAAALDFMRRAWVLDPAAFDRYAALAAHSPLVARIFAIGGFRLEAGGFSPAPR